MKLVGDTVAGQPVFAVGPVQLTLPPGAQHFYPVGACSRCRAIIDFPEPVLTAADLELSGQPHLCQTCARGGVDPIGSAVPAEGSSQPSDVERSASEPPPGPSSPSVGAATSTTRTEPTEVGAPTEPQLTDIDGSPQPFSGASESQFVPAVPDAGDNDSEHGLRAGLEAPREGAGQPQRPAESNGAGDSFDRVGEYVAIVLRSATMRAEEIRADAEFAAAQLVEDAEQRVSEQLAAAVLIVDEADRDRDEVMTLASELEERFAGEQQQMTRRQAEAEAQAAMVREAAEADATRVKEAAEAQQAQAAAVLAEANAAADQQRQAAEAALSEANRQASAIVGAAEAEAARLRESAAPAEAAAEGEQAQAAAVLAEANAAADQQRQAAEAALSEANRQASAIVGAAEAEAARLRDSAAAAESAAEAELEAAIALSVEAGSRETAS